MTEAWVICGLRNQVGPDGTTEWTWVGEKPVSDDEGAAAQDAVNVLVEDSEQKQLNLALDNFKSFFGYLAVVPREFEQARREAVNPVVRVQTELATRLFNWLQSIRAYLDHTQRRLSRRYGDDSLELRTFKEATAKEFDQGFAYRFFYKLRNYGHVDFPALELSIRERAPLGLPREVAVSIQFRRDVLLANFDEWGPVKADLESQAETFPVGELMAEMMQCLDRIKAIVGLAEFGYLAERVGTLERLRERLGEVDGRPTLMRMERGPDGRPKGVQMIDIPPFQLPVKVAGTDQVQDETEGAPGSDPPG